MSCSSLSLLRPMAKRLGHLVLMAVLCFLLACGGKISRENYEKIESNMTKQQVVDILGEPSETEGTKVGPFETTRYTWETKEVRITIQFLKDKVKLKDIKNLN